MEFHSAIALRAVRLCTRNSGGHGMSGGKHVFRRSDRGRERKGGLTMEWYKEPPQILHSVTRAACYRQMIEAAANNIHMRKQATALLECYASHANTFRPAAKVITRQTGIGKPDIWKVRQRLVEYGLIAYQPYPGFIFIDWRRIRTYAQL